MSVADVLFSIILLPNISYIFFDQAEGVTLRVLRFPYLLVITASTVVSGAVAPYPLVAQQPDGGQAPQVIVVGHGEVSAEPDRARIEFGVETRSATATAAAAENRRRMRAVLDTIQRLGIESRLVQTASLQVNPEMVYPGQGQPPRVAGYVARNSVRIEVESLDLTGALVDAAIGRGASNVRGLSFFSSRADELRREALSRAVKSARLDAESMASAASAQLGELLEISSSSSSPGLIYRNADIAGGMMMAAAPAPTPIDAGELKVVETVTIRWRLKQ